MSSVLLRGVPLSQPREAAQCPSSWFRSGKDQIERRIREYFTNYTTTILFLGYVSEISLQSVLLSCFASLCVSESIFFSNCEYIFF